MISNLADLIIVMAIATITGLLGAVFLQAYEISSLADQFLKFYGG